MFDLTHASLVNFFDAVVLGSMQRDFFSLGKLTLILKVSAFYASQFGKRRNELAISNHVMLHRANSK